MSERYSKLFSLSENLYTEGSPVIIAAGALLKDNQTGRIIAQLKLRNISSKTIKAATVSLSLMNTAGNPLGESVRYEYLDLSSTRDTDFGSKSAIPLPDASTRSFSVAVAEVIFADNSVWNANDATWEPLKSPEALTSRLDGEMVKQFRIEYGSRAKNFFLEQKDLWYCVCGAVNHREEKACHSCRKPICNSRDIDLHALEEREKKRLNEEQEQEAQKAEAAQKTARVTKRALAIVLAVVVAVTVVVSVRNDVIIPNRKYKDAEELLNNGEIVEAAIAFHNLGSYKDSSQRCLTVWERILTRKNIASARYLTIGLKADGTVVAVGGSEYGRPDVSGWRDIVDISASSFHAVGLRANGTVAAAGWNEFGQCDISGWTDIVAITAGHRRTVGLRMDGTVVSTTGDNHYGQCDVSDWTNIVSIGAGDYHTVGLKADGTVVAVGSNKSRQCNVSDWTNIVAISVGEYHTVGLRADGTVVVAGTNVGDVSDWTNIVAISAGEWHTVGLRADGSVVVAGEGADDYDVPDWTDIVAIAAGEYLTAGLRADGTVVVAGLNADQCDVSDWTDIVAITAGYDRIVGQKADGTVVAVGNSDRGQCSVSDWTDIKLP